MGTIYPWEVDMESISILKMAIRFLSNTHNKLIR